MLRAPEIVGRQHERDTLTRLSSQGGVVAVVGTAGMGKSVLVRDLAAQSGAVVGRASPPPAPPLRPLAEIAAALVRRGAAVDAAALQLHRRPLSLLLPVPATVAGSETVSPLHIGEALVVLRDTMPRDAPSLAIIEDLHWCDDATLAAIEYLVDAAPSTRLALVLTARPEGPGCDLLRRLAGRRSADLIELGRLGRAEVAELVTACLGGPAPIGLLEAVAVAEGVPLLVEELLAAYAQRDDLRRDDGAWVFSAGARPMPPSIRELVSERVASLSDRDASVLRAAALLGPEVDASLLGSALDLDEGAVRAALALGSSAGLLADDPVAARLRFSHALVRDALIATMSVDLRVRLAGRLLDALAARDDPDLASRAAIAVDAAREDEARRLLLRGGRQQLARGFPAAAVEVLDRALSVGGPGAEELAVREELLAALALAGDADRAVTEGALVRRQLEALGADRGRHDRCVANIARAWANAGRWEDAYRVLAATRPSERQPASSALFARISFELGRFDEAEASAALVMEDAGGAVDASAACEAAEILGRLARRSDLDEAIRWFERAAASAELNDLAVWRARALHELATISQLRTLSIDGLAAARAAAVEASAPGLVASIDFHLAALHGVRFETSAALEVARRLLDNARRLGATTQEAWAWILIGQGHAAAADEPRAAAAAREALDLAGDDAEIVGVARGTLHGLTALLRDDRDRATTAWSDAVAALRRLPGPTPLPPWYLWPLLATVFDLEGDGGERARRETDTPTLRLATGPDGLWHLAHAVALGRAGETKAAADACLRADDCFDALPAFAGYIHLGRRLAAESAIEDHWGDPGSWMTSAAGWFEERSLDRIAAACRALARRAGVRPRRAGRGHATVPAALVPLGITSREVDVLRLVAAGLTNREIAERLYLSPRTVKGYVENLLVKTASANRTQLARFAAESIA